MVLANALTSGRPETKSSQLTKLIGINAIGSTRDVNRVSDEIVLQYIQFADSEIDGVLSQQFYTPFHKCANGQWLLDEDINIPQVAGSSGDVDTAGNKITTTTTGSTDIIVLDSAVNLVPGDEIIIHDDLTGDEEVAIVKELIDQHTIRTEDLIVGSYFVENGDVRIIRIQFPPPLNQISSRLGSSYIYDKFFSSQAQPDISEYGKEMRKIAYAQLNDILNGRINMKCARRRGDLFGNPYLDDIYQLRDRGFNTTERNKSALT